MKEIIGVIGAGRMGLPIIGHLARKGFQTLATDVDATKKAEVEKRGAAWAAGAAALAAQCDVILLCVGFDRQVRELLAGPLKVSPRATLCAILSTIHPRTVQELAKTSGIEVIDTTVCRGGKAADEGTLLSFVGGAAATVERIAPVIKAYSADVVHSGPVGSAQVAKAVNNLIMWACLVADHEGLALARRYGVDTENLRKALLISSAANNALANWGTQTMAWAEDDMAIVADMAAEGGIALPQAGINRELCRALKPRRYKLDDYGN